MFLVRYGIVEAVTSFKLSILNFEQFFFIIKKRGNFFLPYLPLSNLTRLKVKCWVLYFTSAPGKVPAPTAESGPNYLYLTWEPPGAPNGIITGYFLYQDGDLIYTGGQRDFNVTKDLQVLSSLFILIFVMTTKLVIMESLNETNP